MSVLVRCTTNIDSWRHVKWPSRLAAVPAVGSYVRALGPETIRTKMQSGPDEGSVLAKRIETPTLQVVGVTHVGGYLCEGRVEEPYVIIDLHHPNASQLGWLY